MQSKLAGYQIRSILVATAALALQAFGFSGIASAQETPGTSTSTEDPGPTQAVQENEVAEMAGEQGNAAETSEDMAGAHGQTEGDVAAPASRASQPSASPASTQSAPSETSHPHAGAVNAGKKENGVLRGLVSQQHGNIRVAGFQINGRFDLAYEMGNFAVDGAGDPQNSIKSYHHFIFLSRNQEDEWFSFSAEVIDLSFYEVALKLGDAYRLRFGKVLVPFGADPLFHHSYGGVSGFDQKLLPFIWAEPGVVFEANLYQSNVFSLDNDLYAVAGIAGSQDQVLELTGASDPGTVAIGDRIRVGYDKLAASVSLYWDRYADSYNMLLWGFDLSAGYGFLPWSYLDRLAVKMGFLRADIQGSRSSGLLDYYHFGDYLQFDYRLPWTMGIRYRTGTVTMENVRGIFFDDREQKKTSDDTLAHSFTVWKRYRGLTVAAELTINMEAAGEVDNDLFRLMAAIDF
jgi:hypothetical protein